MRSGRVKCPAMGDVEDLHGHEKAELVRSRLECEFYGSAPILNGSFSHFKLLATTVRPSAGILLEKVVLLEGSIVGRRPFLHRRH